MEKVIHEFGPVFDENSKVLVLGTIPSPKSRELGFYYCHPQNRFWRVMAALFQDRFPDSVPQGITSIERAQTWINIVSPASCYHPP